MRGAGLFLGVVSFVIVAGTNAAPPGIGSARADDQRTVDAVDLRRYAGVWYEIARIPNRFQKHCVRNVTATYTLRDDGMIDVVNRCVDDDGEVDQADGVARVVETATRSKLEVSFVQVFGLRLFWGDYWIIGLADDYRYAVVGSPDRKYGWILSRSAVLSAEDREAVFGILRANGYDPALFVFTTHRE